MKIQSLGLSFLCALSAQSVVADEKFMRKVPNEYETVGGYTLGMNNSGVAATGGVSAVRVNPGMLPLEQQYGVVAGYYWPTSGRDFYNAGIVDTKTSSVAAGVSYTGFSKDPEDQFDASPNEIDSPVKQRLSIALAKSFSRLSGGLAGHYVVANKEEQFTTKKVDGVTLGFGLAGLLTPTIRFGASVENLANDKVKNYAPQTIRGGLAYLFARGQASAHLDYRERERVGLFESDSKDFLRNTIDEGYDDPERMLIASFSAKVYDVIRLLAAYGTSVSAEDDRQSLTGGIALISNALVINYNIAKPYLQESKVQHGLSIGITMAM